ncbi:hypothetical protein Avbf_13983 [Armadillidium vulgare]|nr:hypothetical protein Avbf_13983 [Armadillidium vulgare]
MSYLNIIRIKECINPWEKVIPSINLEERDLEIEFGSEGMMSFKKISESSYPKIFLTKLSEEELKESDCYGSIDMKSEIEVKEEPFPIEEEEAANGSIDVKSEIEVYEEPLDIVEEETSNDEHFDKVCGLDQNQECINPREKVMPSKNLEEKDVENEIGSELEMFYKKISESSYPKIVLTKLSEEEIKV